MGEREPIAKSLRSCLDQVDLPYNWDQKLRETLLALSLSHSLLLKDITRTLNRLSAFLSEPRLDFSRQKERLLIAVLKRVGSRRLYLYRGKVVMIIDGTEYEKLRSRGRKMRMPSIGRVRLKNLATRETVLAPPGFAARASLRNSRFAERVRCSGKRSSGRSS